MFLKKCFKFSMVELNRVLANKTPNEKVHKVKQFIEKFSAYDVITHIPPDLSLEKIYELKKKRSFKM